MDTVPRPTPDLPETTNFVPPKEARILRENWFGVPIIDPVTGEPLREGEEAAGEHQPGNPPYPPPPKRAMVFQERGVDVPSASTTWKSVTAIATASTLATAAVLLMLQQKKEPQVLGEVGRSSSALLPAPAPREGGEHTEMFTASLSFEERGTLTQLSLQRGAGTVPIAGSECIAMGSTDADCAWAVRLTSEEAEKLGLGITPRDLLLFSTTIDSKRFSSLTMDDRLLCVGSDVSLERYNEGNEGKRHAALAQALFTHLPEVTRGSKIPTSASRWQDADHDGKRDRDYSWGGKKGVERMNRQLAKFREALNMR